MDEVETKEMLRMVKAALEWIPSKMPETLLEKQSKDHAKSYPTVVTKCCGDCAFWIPDNTCENFQAPIGFQKPPEGFAKREMREYIPIDRQGRWHIYCDAWIDSELVKLLNLGYPPSNIEYGRRHPYIEIPPDGQELFLEYLEYITSKPEPEYYRWWKFRENK